MFYHSIFPIYALFSDIKLCHATHASNIIYHPFLQGRAMIHQMMLLLHLEMQLRQQALNSYTQAHDPVARLARLDEVLALNEQLNEVGPIAINVIVVIDACFLL